MTYNQIIKITADAPIALPPQVYEATGWGPQTPLEIWVSLSKEEVIIRRALLQPDAPKK